MSIFQFKQFSVDQSGCAMKINTDGVLLGAIADACMPGNILDIGTGTGVIALMLAQKFADALIDTVDIDITAAETAGRNFTESVFAHRLSIFPLGFEDFLNADSQKKYDLVVSNPPFYVDSLKSPGPKKALAKHADSGFFSRMMSAVAGHLTYNGCLWLILPVTLEEMIIKLARDNGMYVQARIDVRSYPHSEAHRIIVSFGHAELAVQTAGVTIYERKGVYTEQYRELLQSYFLAF